MLDNYAEETKPLFKLEAFRFVLARYNHYSLVQQLEEDLKNRIPDRPIRKIDARKTDYETLAKTYFSLPRGFLFVENFDDVLIEQYDSQNRETPQYKAENERRRGVTAGLNLRRDKLAKLPVALFAFVPAYTGELYAKIIMEKTPDLWSFRSMILDLERETATTGEARPFRTPNSVGFSGTKKAIPQKRRTISKNVMLSGKNCRRNIQLMLNSKTTITGRKRRWASEDDATFVISAR